MSYVQYANPAVAYECQQILSIPAKQTGNKTVLYISSEGIKLLLEQPDWRTAKGLRDLSVLSLMYESAARVQEIIDLTPSSLSLADYLYTVTLHGKGNKNRIVPISEKVVQILLQYFGKYNLFAPENASHPLFPNSHGQAMSRNAINNILIKYLTKARQKQPALFPEKVLSCHSLRHSKAMHLLESNVELIYIRDFLGHKSVTTTEIYARTNPKYIFDAVKGAYASIATNEIPIWEQDKEILVLLKKLTK